MKAGDLVRWVKGDGRIGLFLEWKTFDKETNPYTCPVIMWAGQGRFGSANKVGTIQASLIEVISECG
jgi:hypothetical protein